MQSPVTQRPAQSKWLQVVLAMTVTSWEGKGAGKGLKVAGDV